MNTINPRTFKTKFEIANAATDLYIKGDGEFFIKDIAKEVDLDPAEIFNYFSNKKSILKFWYASLVIRYELMIDEIEDFNSYTLSEKLSNFAFTSFDMLQERKVFVEATFKELIACSYTKTAFEQELERLTHQFLENDSRLSTSASFILNEYFHAFMRRQYLELIRFWVNDSSEEYELTMELTDKLTNFLQELLYNAILDKGLNLAKFLASNRKAFLENIPFLKQFFSKIEIR